VPEEIRDRVFEPFFTTKARGGGLVSRRRPAAAAWACRLRAARPNCMAVRHACGAGGGRREFHADASLPTNPGGIVHALPMGNLSLAQE
jgi:hypothetical protein